MVTKLDRLGRSLENLIELSADLQERGVDLVVLDQGIDTSTAVGRMFFQILGAIAEFEHALMSERTMDGLAAARARGRTGGQKPKLGPRQVQLARADVRRTRRRRQAVLHRRSRSPTSSASPAPPSTAPWSPRDERTQQPRPLDLDRYRAVTTFSRGFKGAPSARQADRSRPRLAENTRTARMEKR